MANYEVFATFSEPADPGTGQIHHSEESIGDVELLDDATWQDMPESLEINGFSYILEG